MDMEHEMNEIEFDSLTNASPSLKNRYEIYLSCADDGQGIDITTGRPLKTFEEWLAS